MNALSLISTFQFIHLLKSQNETQQNSVLLRIDENNKGKRPFDDADDLVSQTKCIRFDLFDEWCTSKFLFQFLEQIIRVFLLVGFEFLVSFGDLKVRRVESAMKLLRSTVYLFLQRFEAERVLIGFAQNQFDLVVPFEASINSGRRFFLFSRLRNDGILFFGLLFLR